MTREVRTIFLSALMLIVYAVSIFISKGSFVFPFPLNEFIFLAVASQFFWWNKKSNRWAGILAISAGICAVLSNQFFWTFLYGPQEMHVFMEGLTTDYSLLTYYGLILIGGIATIFKQTHRIAQLFGSLFLIAFLSGVALNHALLLLLSFGFMVASTQLSKIFAPYHLLWILLFVLKMTEWLSIFFIS